MYDPTKPIEGTEIDAAELRTQFTGLFDLIQAVPAGPPGPTGPIGPPFAAAQVDSVSTLPPGDAATVSAFFDGTTVRLFFGIPQGIPGEVTSADLATAIANLSANTSGNSNGVALLLPAQPNPTVLDVAQKLDELIQALRR